MMLLVPCDVLNTRRADEHFTAEADAAREAGYTVRLVDHDALVAGDASRAVARIPADDTPAVYRGWMLTAAAYDGFAQALTERGITLPTSAAQYRSGHELPGWYDALAGYTPQSVWTAGTDRDAFDKARAVLGGGAAVLRDYTKSMKHYWNEAVYIPDLTDADAAWRIATRLHELRDEEFTGGFVLRRFENFTGAEARTWWYPGRPVLSVAVGNPDASWNGDLLRVSRHDQTDVIVFPRRAGTGQIDAEQLETAAGADVTQTVTGTGNTVQDGAGNDHAVAPTDLEHTGDLKLETRHRLSVPPPDQTGRPVVCPHRRRRRGDATVRVTVEHTTDSAATTVSGEQP